MPVSGYQPFYVPESPYKLTKIVRNFMAYYVHRRIDPHPLDLQYSIDDYRYVHRPDLLANDFYNDSDLWWVFGVRNGFQDPVFDLTFGKVLYVPDLSYLRRVI